MDTHTPPPDGGWGWAIVFCSIINHAGTIGLMMSLSVLYVSWLDQFGAGKGVTSWILSVGVACMFGLCPIPAILASKYGFRTVGIVGGLLAFTGLTASAFATSILHLIVSIGFVTGIGCCFCYLPGVAMVALYFEKRRSLAMGIATAGTGIGAFGFAPLLDFLERTYGWRGAVLILGAMSLHMCVTGMLLRTLEGGGQEEEMKIDEVTELSCPMDLRDATLDNSEMDVVGPNGGNLSEVDDDYAAPTVIEMKRQFRQGVYDKILDDLYYNNEENCNNSGNCQISDLSSVPSHDGKAIGVYKENNGLQQWTNCRARDVNVAPADIQSRDGTRLFVSLVDLRPWESGTTRHLCVSLHNLNSGKCANRLFQNSTLANIRNVDIHLLTSIRHLLKKPEENESWPQLLSADVEECTQECKENSRKKASFVSRCLSSPIFKANFEMLQEKPFLAFAVSNFLNNLAFMACVVHLLDRALFHGVDKSVGAIIISVNGLGNIFGRLFFGWLANRFFSNHLLMYVSTLVMCGLGTVVSPLCGQMAVLHGIYSFFFGCMMGLYVILAPLVTVYLMGVSKVTTAYGLVLFFMGPATVVGAPFAGWLFDLTKTYVMSYVVNGIFLLASGVMLVPLLLVPKKEPISSIGG